MKQKDILPHDYSDRIDEILDSSWRIFKTQFVEGLYEVTKEAPFQHHFANIISVIGRTYCTKQSDIFFVDLEKKIEYLDEKKKYLDITCEFQSQENKTNAKAAIELKFKTKKQGAQDHGRIDAFVDIEALENAKEFHSFSKARFYMITDSEIYLSKSKKGVGTIFTTYDGAKTKKDSYFHCPSSKGRENVNVHLNASYSFEWEKIELKKNNMKYYWYFLELKI